MAALSGDEFYWACDDPSCRNNNTEKCCGYAGCEFYEPYPEPKETDKKEEAQS